MSSWYDRNSSGDSVGSRSSGGSSPIAFNDQPDSPQSSYEPFQDYLGLSGKNL